MTYAALANGRRCSCGNNVGQQLSDRNCNVKCSGDARQVCGGNAASKCYSLYAVCRIGYFGPNCDRLCHCNRQLPCDRKTGICSDRCDESWTGTSCNINYIQKQYIGCYGDGPVRAMSALYHSGITLWNKDNSIEICIEICSTNNYTYAGMQYGDFCMCGERYNWYGNKTYTNETALCNFPCPANRSQRCGGNFANSVYYVCPVSFYGRDCISRCQCNGGPCRFSGSCLTSTLNFCKPGWTGSACNVRDCEVNNGNCETDEKCETVDLGYANFSICRCKDGSYRHHNRCRPVHRHYVVGCYKGNTTQYASVELQTNDTLTIEFCILKCRQLNKKYSIIQGGIACFCGDDYGYISPDEECKVPCAGNMLQYCGGKNTVDGTPIYIVYSAKSLLPEYIGCYKDEMDPAIKLRFFGGGAENTTIDSCIRQCAFHNFTYAGLQYSYVCVCGDSFDKYGQLPESSCNMNCTGNRNQICGGTWANSVYAVNDILWCSTDIDCKQNEVCDVVNLRYGNVSRCRCKQGFHRLIAWDRCTDVDECQLDRFSSPCNTFLEYCSNSIGSYICACKEGYAKISGNCEEFNNNPTTGIILASLLAIVLLINVLFVISRIKSVNSNQDPLKVGTEYDIQARCVQSDQQEIIYDEIKDLVDRNSGYEQIILEGREIVQDPTSEYAALKHDDYLNVETST